MFTVQDLRDFLKNEVDEHVVFNDDLFEIREDGSLALVHRRYNALTTNGREIGMPAVISAEGYWWIAVPLVDNPDWYHVFYVSSDRLLVMQKLRYDLTCHMEEVANAAK